MTLTLFHGRSNVLNSTEIVFLNFCPVYLKRYMVSTYLNIFNFFFTVMQNYSKYSLSGFYLMEIICIRWLLLFRLFFVLFNFFLSPALHLNVSR